ncbi:MAG: hypothetical protein GY819_01065 [Planctomycetaceae bacterium]|nr:hypothetical protein [Planctomycetaceae bacterium]
MTRLHERRSYVRGSLAGGMQSLEPMNVLRGNVADFLSHGRAAQHSLGNQGPAEMAIIRLWIADWIASF